MGINTNGLIDNYLIWEEVADAIQRTYGLDAPPEMSTTYSADFVKLTFPQRSQLGRRDEWRSMSVFLNGYCEGDYAEVTRAPVTLVTLGWGGDSEEIIGGLVTELGGWFRPNDSDDDGWHRIDPKRACVAYTKRMERAEARLRAYTQGALF